MDRTAQWMGAALWLSVFGLTGWALWGHPAAWTAEVFDFFTHSTRRVPAVVAGKSVRPRTPVFFKDPEQHWHLVGHVESVDSVGTVESSVQLRWYGPSSIDHYDIAYYESSNSLASVLKILLPPEKQKLVRDRLRQVFDEHSDEMVGMLKPIFERSVKESLPAIEDGFRQSVERHHEDIDRISDKYKSEVVKQKLVPLVREEVFPIVRKHAEPLARQIGRELWDRASIWRFGWRYLYDKSPLPDKKLVKEEWERFVENEAIPVLQSHADEMVEAQQLIFAELSSNPRIKEQLKEVGEMILHDKDLHELARDLLTETLLENQALHDVWIRNWRSQDAQDALDSIGDRLEPIIREIGDEIFGTKDKGITPEFARVLRTQILGKDKRWFVASSLPEGYRQADKVRHIARGDSSSVDAPLLLTNEE